MKFQAFINILPHKELLDPQGKTVGNNLKNVGILGVEDVRIGKHIVMILDADSEDQAREMVELACKKLLANIIMETFSFQLKSIS